MKQYVRLLCSVFLISFMLIGCGKEEKKEKKLSEEFTLVKTLAGAGAEKLEDIIFATDVTVAKVSSFRHDSSGSPLGYTLNESDTEKLIKLIQENEVYGVKVDKEEYEASVKNLLSGFMIEFMDSFDQFKEGVARISFITNKDTYYMNLIRTGKETEIYRISLPDDVVVYLNEKSEENYEQSTGNPGWFNKAFQKAE